VAGFGVFGTLVSPALARWVASRDRREDHTYQQQRATRIQEREDAQGDWERRRASFVELNVAARHYRHALRQFVSIAQAQPVSDIDREALDDARVEFESRYGEAQLVVPDGVLDNAVAVERVLSTIYGQVRRLERGSPRPDESWETTIENLRKAWDALMAMRRRMRQDLGVSPIEPPPIRAVPPTDSDEE
jgi:hypothetical protein